MVLPQPVVAVVSAYHNMNSDQGGRGSHAHALHGAKLASRQPKHIHKTQSMEWQKKTKMNQQIAFECWLSMKKMLYPASSSCAQHIRKHLRRVHAIRTATRVARRERHKKKT